jgi:hypothetical protein
MRRIEELEAIAQIIIDDMSLREKAIIASLSYEDISYCHSLFDICPKDQLGKHYDMSKDVMHRVWEILQETHRIKSVK